MGGVLVSIKREGSTITTTVVTDEQGRYSDSGREDDPGKYTLAIRAIGYRLDGPKTVDVPAGGAAYADLKLGKVKSLVPQLSNGEWLLSLPGPDRQKAFLTMCVGCHTLQRVLTSQHDAAEFQQVFLRMARYRPELSPPIRSRCSRARGERPAVVGDAAKAAAEFLASVSLGNAEAIEFRSRRCRDPRTRHQGRHHRVRYAAQEAMPYDVIVDRDGMVWYSDFGHAVRGRDGPRTGEIKDIAIPVLSPEQPQGGLDIELDPRATSGSR